MIQTTHNIPSRDVDVPCAVPEGHHPRGTTFRRLSKGIHLSEEVS